MLDMKSILIMNASMIKSVKETLFKPVTPKRLYKLALVVFLSSFPLAIIMTTVDIDKISWVLYLGALLVAIGFCWESVTFFAKISKNSMVLSILIAVFLGAFTTTVASIYAEHTINMVTGLEIKHFSNSKKLLTILLMPIVWLYLSAFILSVYYIGSMVLFPFRLAHNKLKQLLFKDSEIHDLPVDVEVARTIGAIIVFVHISMAIGYIPSFEDKTPKAFVSLLVAVSDYHLYGPCKNIEPGEAYKIIDKDLISVARDTGSYFLGTKIEFEDRICEG
ncbi:hypothetical protein WKI13_02420 [Teredinibacter turnerae]|uniref:hypothetical protein n=1 Tax=Teredinibacter turnerae TaxID=2426 RepID=UPI0003621C51|nr:hypothetical protein [Teredinibacter turnerae]